MGGQSYLQAGLGLNEVKPVKVPGAGAAGSDQGSHWLWAGPNLLPASLRMYHSAQALVQDLLWPFGCHLGCSELLPTRTTYPLPPPTPVALPLLLLLHTSSKFHHQSAKFPAVLAPCRALVTATRAIPGLVPQSRTVDVKLTSLSGD